jgi:hypothetical protein
VAASGITLRNISGCKHFIHTTVVAEDFQGLVTFSESLSIHPVLLSPGSTSWKKIEKP